MPGNGGPPPPTPSPASPASPASPGRRDRPARVGLVAGGLGEYWPQFPGLRAELERMTAALSDRLRADGAEVVDGGFVSDAAEATAAAERLRASRCDLVLDYLATYQTATMIVPVVQRCGAPVVFVTLQPGPAMDHATIDTGRWLSYCGSCALPEAGNTVTRLGLPFRSVAGHLGDDRAWARIGGWTGAAAVAAGLRDGRHGLLGHLYPGMYDVATDITTVPARFGGHVEILELDDVTARLPGPGADVDEVVARARETFEIDESVRADDLLWSARLAVALRRLVADFALDSLAYYHRGLDGNENERVAAGLILGASLLTADGIPVCGEFELRTSLAMLLLERLGAGGAFTEMQALDFTAGVVEMGHDGPGHLAVSDGRPVLRGLGVYHGKRGAGVSVEFDVRHGPATLLGVSAGPDGRPGLVAAEGEVVGGPHMRIGNTTSRVDFGRDPGEWCEAWSGSGVGHHWALGTGHQVSRVRQVADLLGLELAVVR
jgi:L-arabinose isomerase